MCACLKFNFCNYISTGYMQVVDENEIDVPQLPTQAEPNLHAGSQTELDSQQVPVLHQQEVPILHAHGVPNVLQEVPHIDGEELPDLE